MQLNFDTYGNNSHLGIWVVLAIVLLSPLVGCSNSSVPNAANSPKQPFSGLKLRLAADHDTLGNEILRRLVAWKARTGATIELGPLAEADLAIIPATNLGRWYPTPLAEVPELVRNSNHPLGWSRCLATYTERLAKWNGVATAIPIAGDAFVLLYRSDRLSDPAAMTAFQTKTQRLLAPPTTWEDIAELAEFFAARGGPSLPPPTADFREFLMLAACYDRAAISSTTLVAMQQKTPDRVPPPEKMFSFFHDLQTGQPRIASPSFVEAATLLKKLQPYRMPSQVGPAEAVVNGTAICAIVSLAELGRLPKDANGLLAAANVLGIAPLPGTRTFFDFDGTRKPAIDGGRNFVPVYGLNSWFGVVRKSCAAPDAAFDALAELGGLTKSVDLMSDPTLGFGPFRTEHLDTARQGLWSRYGFDGPRTQQLADAVRGYAGVNLANAAYTLRTSDAAELMSSLGTELQKCLAGGTPLDAMKATEAAWKALDAKRPADAVKTERQIAAGVR